MKLKKYLIFFFFFFLIFNTNAISISGGRLVVEENFEPGLITEESYVVGNAEGYTVDYNIVTSHKKGHDLTPYFTFTPDRIEGVKNGGHASFSIKMELPEKIDTPGLSETWVMARIDREANGVLTALPSIGIRYLIYVLYPDYYIDSRLVTSNMNLNEKKEFYVNVENLGEPTINSMYADFKFYDSNNNLLHEARSQTETNTEPFDVRKLIVEFDAQGLSAGNYKTNATLYWDDGTEKYEKVFKIGSKNVAINNYTKRFEYDAISKLDIEIESKWNTRIENIYAKLTVFDKQGNKLKSFKSVNTELNPWEIKDLEAYFDASGISKGKYDLLIELMYEGTTTTVRGEIEIDENINAEVFEEIPDKFHLKDYMTTKNIFIAMIVLFTLLNVYILSTVLLKKKHKDDELDIDQAIIDKIKELRDVYNDKHIKEMLIKKGWDKKRIDLIFKRLK